MNILAINPGGTSTKVAVYAGTEEVFVKTIPHKQEDILAFTRVFDQLPYRTACILDELHAQGIALESLDAIVGRGGLLKPIPGGTYAVSPSMLQDLENAVNGEHPSNLGPVIANDLAQRIGKPAFTVDPVSVDEFIDIARLSGLEELQRPSWLHALNIKAVCRSVAESMGQTMDDLNFIVAHMGSGNSVVAHKKGKMVDGSGGRTNGPFSPERCGALPTYPLVNLCYSGKYTKDQMVAKISTTAGMYDFLGTKDAKQVEETALAGNPKAKLVLDAFIYQVAKEICSYATPLRGKVDRIILTGGIAYSPYITQEIERYVDFLGPVVLVPGEKEMESLAKGALRVLAGVEQAKTY